MEQKTLFLTRSYGFLHEQNDSKHVSIDGRKWRLLTLMTCLVINTAFIKLFKSAHTQDTILQSFQLKNAYLKLLTKRCGTKQLRTIFIENLLRAILLKIQHGRCCGISERFVAYCTKFPIYFFVKNSNDINLLYGCPNQRMKCGLSNFAFCPIHHKNKDAFCAAYITGARLDARTYTFAHPIWRTTNAACKQGAISPILPVFCRYYLRDAIMLIKLSMVWPSVTGITTLEVAIVVVNFARDARMNTVKVCRMRERIKQDARTSLLMRERTHIVHWGSFY